MPDNNTSLTALGWTSSFDTQWQNAAYADTCMPARISLQHGFLYSVKTATGDFLAELPGKFRHQNPKQHWPVVGDWVAFTITETKKRGSIIDVLPRHTSLSRKEAGDKSKEQVLAANIDICFIMVAMDQTFNIPRLERFLTVIHSSGAAPIILLNKSDLSKDINELEKLTQAISGKCPIHTMSLKENSGLEAIETYLKPGKTYITVGASGVGKSTLLNSLFQDYLQKTSEVREGDGKGKHTTTHRELFCHPSSGAIIIDTPGMRELQLWEDDGGLIENFKEIIALSETCKFPNCTHLHEPGCQVKANVESGELDSSRVYRYQKQQAELQAAADRKQAHVRTEKHKKQTKVYKAMIKNKRQQ